MKATVRENNRLWKQPFVTRVLSLTLYWQLNIWELNSFTFYQKHTKNKRGKSDPSFLAIFVTCLGVVFSYFLLEWLTSIILNGGGWNLFFHNYMPKRIHSMLFGTTVRRSVHNHTLASTADLARSTCLLTGRCYAGTLPPLSSPPGIEWIFNNKYYQFCANELFLSTKFYSLYYWWSWFWLSIFSNFSKLWTNFIFL